jgi:hypothetical protein
MGNPKISNIRGKPTSFQPLKTNWIIVEIHVHYRDMDIWESNFVMITQIILENAKFPTS